MFEEAIDNVKYGLDEEEPEKKEEKKDEEIDFLADPKEKKQAEVEEEEKEVDLLDLDVQNTEPTYQPNDELIYDKPKEGIVYEQYKEEQKESDAFAFIEIENLDPKKVETIKKDVWEQKKPEEDDAFAFLDIHG